MAQPSHSKYAIGILAATLALSALPLVAFAEDIDTDPQPDALQLEVERSAEAYQSAIENMTQIEDALAENEARIAELQKLIPEQQRKSNEAAVALYKSQIDSAGLLDLLLGSASVEDLFFRVDAINRVTLAHETELSRLVEMQNELAATTEQLEADRAAAEESVNAADRALTAAQTARLEAQRRAEEEAQRQAEAAAAAAAAQAPAQSEEPESEAPAETVAAETVVSDGADWTSDQESFIAEWTWRIDAYLAGSPLAGQGRTFAEAAWNYGVDPRWSPAISYTESSKGAACYMPHNAWGWGGCEWDSWEEAINDHVRGLARGYGYTISMEAAQKYCPPNAQHWYDVTYVQMKVIRDFIFSPPSTPGNENDRVLFRK
ncbi:MAG: hypothetical protein IKE20_08045, partial [Eggerthellaceae bacterium]|nr:hypothetical protein [Eggerthellaceae bacterium]